MKVIFEKNVLEATLSRIMGCVSNKNTLQAIEGVRIETREGGCVMTGYDLEKGCVTNISAAVGESGVCVIAAAKLSQIVHLMPDGQVALSIDEKGTASISGGRSRFEIHTLSSDDYPTLPTFEGANGFKVADSLLRDMILRTMFSAAQNDTRAALNGVYFDVSAEKLNLVACDGNRLALRSEKQAAEFGDASGVTNVSFIVPGKALGELIKLLDDDPEKKIEVRLGRKHAMFGIDENTMFFTRVIDSEYIDYNRFIPTSFKTTVLLSAADFLSALERASLVTEEKVAGQVRSAVRCAFDSDGVAKISSVSVSGRSDDEFPITIIGDPIELAFNCRFLLDAVRATGVDKIKLSLQSPLMSMVIEPAEEETNEAELKRVGKGYFLFLALPVRLKE